MELNTSLFVMYGEQKPNDATFKSNKALIEQLLTNFAIEKADMEKIIANLKELRSDRIRLSILKNLGERINHSRFYIISQDELYLSSTEDELIAQFMHSLTHKYWHTLFYHLNLRNILPCSHEPALNKYETKYVCEDHCSFDLENIKGFFGILENLYTIEHAKAKLADVVRNYNIVFERQKNGSTKVKVMERDLYNQVKGIIADSISAAHFLSGGAWYNNSQDNAKRNRNDVKGVEWMTFKNSAHILTLDKETSEIFRKVYELDF